MSIDKKYSDLQLINAVQNSFTYADVCRKLNLPIHGGSYHTLKTHINKLNINTSHFGYIHVKEKKTKVNIEKYLTGEKKISTYKLKTKLLRDGLLKCQCQICKNTIWNNQPIPTELHHIDGNRNNNQLSNLQILCPNCHTQTHNYAGKKTKKIKYCDICHVLVDKKYAKKCENCRKKSKIPPKIELEKIVLQLNIFKVAEHYTVSRSTIQRWCSIYSIDMPDRRYSKNKNIPD